MCRGCHHWRRRNGFPQLATHLVVCSFLPYGEMSLATGLVDIDFKYRRDWFILLLSQQFSPFCFPGHGCRGDRKYCAWASGVRHPGNISKAEFFRSLADACLRLSDHVIITCTPPHLHRRPPHISCRVQIRVLIVEYAPAIPAAFSTVVCSQTWIDEKISEMVYDLGNSWKLHCSSNINFQHALPKTPNFGERERAFGIFYSRLNN